MNWSSNSSKEGYYNTAMKLKKSFLRFFYILQIMRVVLKLPISQNLIVINHKFYSNFKNHIIIKTQEEHLKLLREAW